MSYTPPFCKVCQNNHGLGDPHIWGKGPKEEAAEVKESLVTTDTTRPKKAKLAPKGDTTPDTTKDTTQKEKRRIKTANWRKKNQEKYNEYMRTLRAKDKFPHLENTGGGGI